MPTRGPYYGTRIAAVPPDSRNRNLFTTIVGSGVEEGDPAFDSDDDLYSARMNGMPGSTTSTTASKPRWMGANKAETVTLIKDLLDSDRPQLSQLIIDHLQSDDAHIMRDRKSTRLNSSHSR